MVPPGRLPAAGGTDYSLQREGKGKTHQGHIYITSIPHCNRGVKGGGAPHEDEKTELRKADADKTKSQSVQGVQGRFYLSSHFLLTRFYAKNVGNGYMCPAQPAQAPPERITRCKIRCFLPCTRCTTGARRQRPGAGLRRQTGSCIVQNADFNTLYFTDSGFWGQVCSFMSILDFVIFSLRFSL